MNRRDPVDRELTAWIAEQDRSRPDYLAEVLSATRRTSQRPAWSFPGRWIPMQLTFERAGMPRAIPYLALLALLAVALAAGALLFVGSQRKVVPPFGNAANGHLAYGSASGDIVTVDPATAEVTVLVGGPELDSSPGLLQRRQSARVHARGRRRLRRVCRRQRRRSGDAAYVVTTPPASGPAWSPDGNRIAFEADGRIWVTSTDGLGPEVELPLGEASSAHGVGWRPPLGDEILFKGCAQESRTNAEARPLACTSPPQTAPVSRSPFPALTRGPSRGFHRL